MTTLAPDTLERPDLLDLPDVADPAEPVLCQINSCADRTRTRPAVATLVRTLPCCTRRAPICDAHRQVLLAAQADHLLVICPDHLHGGCAHLALTFEPLP